MPVLVGKGRDFGGFDFTASAPEHIGVGNGDTGFDKVGVDGGFELHDAVLLGAVGDSHDVHIVELRASFAPVAMRETFVAADLCADLFFTSDGNGPVEKSIETGHTNSGLRGFDMFKEGGKTAQQLAFLEGFGHGMELLQGDPSLFGTGDPSGLADLCGGEFPFKGHEDTPFVIGEVHDTCFEHAGKSFGFVAGLDALAAHVADTKGKDALRRHEPVGLRASDAHEKAAMLIERLAGGHFQGRPELVGLTGDFGIRRADDDMAGERILTKHEFKGGIELFGGHFPSHEGAFGEIRGEKRLADAADRSGFNHGADALEDGWQVHATETGNFLKGFARKTGNLVFGDGKDAGVDGVVVLGRNHWKEWMIAAHRASLQGGMFFCRAVSCNQTHERYACGLIF